MASSFGFVKALLILLAMSSAIANPVPVYEYAPGGVRPSSVLPRQLHPRATSTCAADNILRDLRNPTQTAAASTFCSLYLQPTTVTTSTLSISQTGTATYSTTTTATVTTTSTDIISTTVTCAASPTAPVTCNYQALYNYGVSFISSTPGVDNTTCHEDCLANPACQSFQVADPSSIYYPYCNLFSENTLAPGNVAANAESEFTFFDRDCPDYLPEECTSSPPVVTVTAKKHKRTVALPTYFATVPASRISSACSCFIASPAPTSTSVVVVTTTVSFTTTTSGTETDTATATAFATTTETSIATASP